MQKVYFTDHWTVVQISSSNKVVLIKNLFPGNLLHKISKIGTRGELKLRKQI